MTLESTLPWRDIQNTDTKLKCRITTKPWNKTLISNTNTLTEEPKPWYKSHVKHKSYNNKTYALLRHIIGNNWAHTSPWSQTPWRSQMLAISSNGSKPPVTVVPHVAITIRGICPFKSQHFYRYFNSIFRIETANWCLKVVASSELKQLSQYVQR